MKFSVVAISLTALTTLGVVGAVEWQRNQRQEQQITAYEQHVQQLLDEVEASSLRRLEAEKELEQMRSSLAEVRSQITSVNNRLEEAQEQINPEYDAIEQRIRREIRAELQTQRPQQTSTSKTSLLRELSRLDPAEMGNLMTMQSMYGGFLQSLNVDDARLEIIVDGLSNMIAEQNQARMDLMLELQRENADPSQFRERMQAINDPATQAEALSFVLTDEEMALFKQFQANQPQQGFTRTLIQSTTGAGPGLVTPGGSATGVFLAVPPSGPSSGPPSGPTWGSAPAILNYEIITAEPN